MPLKCPKCSRINADSAQSCVYCKSSLENAQPFTPPEDIARLAQHFLKKGEPETKKPASPAAPQKTDSQKPVKKQKVALKMIPGGPSAARRHMVLPQGVEPVERFWVVMAPIAQLGKALNNQLAERLKIDPFVVKQRIAAGNPWVLRRFAKAEQAQELAKDLQRLGLDVYSLTDSEIKAVPERMNVQKVTLLEDGFAFEREKDKIEARWSDVSLVVRGRIRMELTDEAIGKRPFSKLTNRGWQAMASDRWEYEVADLYTRAGRGARLSERDTNFSGLGKQRNLSSLRNLHWIINQFKERGATLIDDGYRKTTRLLKHVGVKGDNVAKRLRRQDQKQITMEYKDNSEHFDEYSSITFLHFRKLEG